MLNVNSPSRNQRKWLDVLAIAKNDWANSMYRYCRCLQKLRLSVLPIKGEEHIFKYPAEAPVHPSLKGKPLAFSPCVVMAPGLESLMENAHVIHLFASTWPLVAFDWNERNVVVQHGGTAYRVDPDACNATMDPHASATIIQCPDLLNLGASNEHWIYYPVDTDFIQPDFERKNPRKLVVGHFPSDPAVKGTETILHVLKKFEAKIDYKGIRNFQTWHHHVAWQENLERMKQCDIIIETLAPQNYGQPFGEWGNTCLEAAALGKIVITNCHSKELYEEEHGTKLSPCIANDAQELESVLKDLTYFADWAILDLKKQTRTWAEDHHSINATAKRLWDRVYKEFF